MIKIDNEIRIKRIIKLIPSMEKTIYSRYQQSLEILSIRKKNNVEQNLLGKKKSFIYKLFKFYEYLYMFCISIKNLITKINKEYIIIYIITKNNEIDDRCKIFTEKYRNRNVIYLRHEGYTDNQKRINLENVIYYEIIVSFLFNIYKKFDLIRRNKIKYTYLRELHIKSSINICLLNFIFKFIKIKYFISIDDSRHTGEMRFTAAYNKIKTIAIQHGQISPRFKGLSKFRFNFYILWGPIFLSQLLKHNYDETTFISYGLPLILYKELMFYEKEKKENHFSKLRNQNSILIIKENQVEDNFYINLIGVLKKENFNVYLRPKSENFINKSIFNLNDSNIILNNNFYQSLKLINPLVVIGTKSTALIESWLFDIPSIIIKSPHNEPNIFPGKYSIFYSVNIIDLNFILKYVNLLSSEEIIYIKEYLWGNFSERKSISKIIDHLESRV